MNGHRHTDANGFYRKRDILFRLLVVGFVVFAALFAFYRVGTHLEKKDHAEQIRGDLTGRFASKGTIEHAGVTYRERDRITTLLLLGIDAVSSSQLGLYRSGGQADFVFLLVLDAEAKTITPLQIDRDTMTEITILGVLGHVAGERVWQICLSHAFGNTTKISDGLTAQAVSGLLLEKPMDETLSMRMDGIEVLNDSVGGVRVTLEEDFSEYDPQMTKGTTLTLQGVQAEYFTRNRMGVGSETNVERMNRQRMYIQGLFEALKARIEEDEGFVNALLDAIAPYMESTMNRGKIINVLWKIRDYTLMPTQTLSGEYATGRDGFVEFYPDEQALCAQVVALFYEPVQ